MENTIYTPKARSKSKCYLTLDQIKMLKKEYSINLTSKHTEADALKILRKLPIKLGVNLN